MGWSYRIGRLLRPGLWAALLLISAVLLLIPAVLPAADRTPAKPLPKGEPVEIFAAVEKGQIEVQLIPRDSTRCNLLVKNKTDKPLNVILPQAFAGVPVLAQVQDGIGLLGDDRLFDNARAPQILGIGPGLNNWRGPGLMNVGPQNFGRPNAPQGLLFNVAPEKVGRMRLTSVCLEYGKPDPRPRFKYQIKPIESVTDKPAVVELCAMLGRGEIGQRPAQLAAWHLSNAMSWQQLASFREKLTLGTRPTYSRQELQAGQKAAERAIELAKQHQRPKADKAKSLSQR